MRNTNIIQQRIRELKARAEVLAGQLPQLVGNQLRNAERELRALEIIIRHYEEKLRPRRAHPSFPSPSDRNSTAV